MRVGRASGLGPQERLKGTGMPRLGRGRKQLALESLVCPLGRSSIAEVLAPEKGPHLLTGAHLDLADGVDGPHSQENLLEDPAQARATHPKKPN